jgi:PTH1 family peptidyl-tRNA hydrolase
MTQGITLIVGLGNPGAEYAETRHNAGFRFIDALLEGSGLCLRAERRFFGQTARLELGQREVWLLTPTTFMNHSGQAVVSFVHYYRIPVPQVLVVHDELDLPPGTVRLKLGGGDGGHNGVQDIMLHLGSTDFARLRIGIGRPAPGGDATAYVLKKSPLAERELIDAAISRARDHIVDIVHGHYQKVMNELHTHSGH